MSHFRLQFHHVDNDFIISIDDKTYKVREKDLETALETVCNKESEIYADD